jgi:hypothetical protein
MHTEISFFPLPLLKQFEIQLFFYRSGMVCIPLPNILPPIQKAK